MRKRCRPCAVTVGSDVRRPAYIAAALAFASAGVSLFWTLGGTFLLETVGGAIEDLARERSGGAIALGAGVTLLKVAAGVLALALARPFGARLGARPLIGINSLAALALVLWGGINVVAGALVLGGIVTTANEADESALRWHVLVWDLWFLLWGLALALATARYRHHARSARPPD